MKKQAAILLTFLLLSSITVHGQCTINILRQDSKETKMPKSVYVDSTTINLEVPFFRVLNDPHYWHDLLTETFTFIKVDINSK
ncbi:hypothetical protein DYU05_13360 [Mucilaginibacter terrenus]|uniref:Uncharacterized protein n=1 Tax=Mucilaginibacter terrenus TaxID=2482727 RepID=A0A3E2NQG6_9SPHI|nr:hypothetical protein DYU05_13360 [Mucilaginibacter terrenus]